MAKHSVATLPARIRFHSSDLSCDVSKVYAYRARCACGWEGPRRGSHREAREDAKLHRSEESIAEVAEATGWAEAS